MKKTLVKIVLSIFCFTFIYKVYAEDGLNLDMAFFKLNQEVSSLNDNILSLKQENELLKEGQRLNNQKISELFAILKLKLSENQKKKVVLKTDIEKNAFKLYSDGKNQFAIGEYNKAIELLKSYLTIYPSFANIEDSKLWLGRAYFEKGAYIDSKTTYLEFQSKNINHPKYADSLFELSRVLIELKEFNNAKLLLLGMVESYPNHSLIKKANQILLEL